MKNKEQTISVLHCIVGLGNLAKMILPTVVSQEVASPRPINPRNLVTPMPEDEPDTPDPIDAAMPALASTDRIFKYGPLGTVFLELCGIAPKSHSLCRSVDGTAIIDGVTEGLANGSLIIGGSSTEEDTFGCTVIRDDCKECITDDVVIVIGKKITARHITCDVLVAIDADINVGTLNVDKHAAIYGSYLAAKKMHVRDGIIAVDKCKLTRFSAADVMLYTAHPVEVNDRVIHPAVENTAGAYDVDAVSNSAHELFAQLQKLDIDKKAFRGVRVRSFGLLPEQEAEAEAEQEHQPVTPQDQRWDSCSPQATTPADAAAKTTEEEEAAKFKLFLFSETVTALLTKISNQQLIDFVGKYAPVPSGITKKELIAMLRVLGISHPLAAMEMQQLLKHLIDQPSAQ